MLLLVVVIVKKRKKEKENITIIGIMGNRVLFMWSTSVRSIG